MNTQQRAHEANDSVAYPHSDTIGGEREAIPRQAGSTSDGGHASPSGEA